MKTVRRASSERNSRPTRYPQKRKRALRLFLSVALLGGVFGALPDASAHTADPNPVYVGSAIANDSLANPRFVFNGSLSLDIDWSSCDASAWPEGIFVQLRPLDSGGIPAGDGHWTRFMFFNYGGFTEADCVPGFKPVHKDGLIPGSPGGFTAAPTGLYEMRFVGASTGTLYGRAKNTLLGEPPKVDPKQTYGSCGVETPSQPVDAVNPTLCGADPINTATGAFTTSATDLALPGIGIPFSVQRTYTSADTTVGPLGPGWTHSYAASLIVAQNGDVTLRAESGQQLKYIKKPDGTFAADTGGRSRLSQVTGGYELSRADQTKLAFDTNGKLTSISDRKGNDVVLSYAPDGTIGSVTDTVGRSITFVHNPSGLLSGVALPDGRNLSYSYTGGRLTSVTDVRGGITTYGYDLEGRLDKIIDQKNNTVVQNTYGADGRVTGQVDARGNAAASTWDATTETSTITDTRGKVWKDVYKNNILKSRTDPLGNKTSYGYDADLNLTSVTDPRGNTWTMTYDARGNLLTRTAPIPLSYGETFTYDGTNNVTSHTNGRGSLTTFGYDAQGNLTTITEPGPTVTLLGRDPLGTGLVKSITNPRGKVTQYEHDAAGNLNRVISPSGNITTMGYDSAGRLSNIVEPRGNVTGANPADYRTTITYDAANHATTVTDPLEHITQWAYDPAGNLTRVTDANNHQTNYGYNTANHLTSVTAPDTSVTSYTYDPMGNILSRTDANNHTADYGYDDANRLVSVSHPTNKVWTYNYDPNGNLKEVIDASGNATATAGDGKTTFNIDEVNRIEAINYSDATPDVVLDHDANGNLVSMNDGDGTETYVYDSLDRLTSVARGSDAFAYEYNGSSQVTKRTYPDSTVVDYVYNDDSLLNTVTAAGAVTTYDYDPAGRLKSVTLPVSNGFVENRTYDRAGRLTHIGNVKGSTTLSEASYAYDPVGNPTSMTTLEGVTTYDYDALDRLTEACVSPTCPGLTGDPTIAYTYDNVGNRLTEERPLGTKTYSYDPADRLQNVTTLTGTTVYDHDANGNMTVAGSDTFTYDLANRMKSATRGSQTTSYTYAGDGRRLEASAGPNAGDKIKFLWDVNWSLPQLTLERNGSGSQLRRYVTGNDAISVTGPEGVNYYHYDALGSVVRVTSATGVPQWSYSYEPFGASHSATKVNPLAQDNPMRYTGEYLDPTGLYHLRARQYDSLSGRFLSTDPIPAPATDPYVSSYVYVRNRPTLFTDPSGMSHSSCWDQAVAGEIDPSGHPCIIDKVGTGTTYGEIAEDIYNGTVDAAYKYGPACGPATRGAPVIGAAAGFVVGGPVGAAAGGEIGVWISIAGVGICPMIGWIGMRSHIDYKNAQLPK